MRTSGQPRFAIGGPSAIERPPARPFPLVRTSGCLLLSAALLGLVAGCGDGATGPGDDETGGNGGQDFSHTRAPGASARAFLSDEEFTSLTVEIDHVEGLQPSQEAVDSLRVFLERRLHKPGGVSIVLDDAIPSPGQSPYSADEVRDFEGTHRDTFTEGSELAGYYLFLDGEFEQQSVLGIAYFNTSMAIFEEVIRENSGGIGAPPTSVIEAASVRHEMGHILGLVNSGTPMQGEQGGPNDHHDEANGAHCTEEGTLMYHQVETTDFIQNLQGGAVPPLDPLGIEDLQANGGK
jgi:hypothetical protein